MISFEVFALLTGVVVGTLLSIAIFWDDAYYRGVDQTFRQAIELGYADYCPKTDSFAWKGGCE